MPTLRVRPALPADAPALQAIRFAAFRTGPISQAMWPGAMTDDSRAKAVANLTKETEARGGGADHTFVLVAELLPEGHAAVAETEQDPLSDTYAVDPEPVAGAEIVGFAKWNLHAAPRPAEEWDVDPPLPTRERFGDGMDLELWDAFIGEMKRMRRRLIRGRAHFLLDFLATSPDRQRLGAGAALIRWGTGRADARGLECWIEATPAGYPLYQRHGFTDVAVVDLDMAGRSGQTRRQGEDWGLANGLDVITEEQKLHGEGWYRAVMMQRPVKGSA